MKDLLAVPRRSFRRLEPTLGAEEAGYRLRALAEDRRQAQWVAAAAAITLLLANLTDSFVGQFNAGALDRLWLFGAVGTFTAAVAVVLGRLKRPVVFDRLILVWVVVLVVLTLYLHATAAAAYTEGATVLLALGAYTILPVPLQIRIIPAVLLTVGDIWIQLRVERAPPITLLPVLLVYGFVHVIGIWSSAAYQTARRRQFAAQSREQVVREELERMANYDALTGVFSRRQFLERAEAEFGRNRRYGSPFTLFIADLDFFKRVNDEHGHLAGDEVLRRFAGMLDNQRRESDLVGRLGGEEFGMLLPETPSGAAIEVAERIRDACRVMVVPVPGADVRITCSIGMAEAVPADAALGDLMQRADAALYDAKRDGRDQVRVAEP